jgi:hypothetical protein
MRRAVELMRSNDERVATVCIQIILDRAGVRPIVWRTTGMGQLPTKSPIHGRPAVACQVDQTARPRRRGDNPCG